LVEDKVVLAAGYAHDIDVCARMVDVHNVIDYVRAPADSCFTICIIFFVWLELMNCVLLLFESLLGCQGR
jgi:hypothetical protein